MKRLLIVAILLATTAPSVRAQTHPARRGPGAQHTLIWALPAQEVQAKRRFHRLADSGNSADMRNASAAYQEALVGMVVRVAARYYPPGHFGPKGIRPRLEAILDARGKLGYDIVNVDGDGTTGSIALLGLDGEACSQAEDALKDMVEAIFGQAGDDGDARWLAAWNKAERTGD